MASGSRESCDSRDEYLYLILLCVDTCSHVTETTRRRSSHGFFLRQVHSTPRIPPCRGAFGASETHTPRPQRHAQREKHAPEHAIFFAYSIRQLTAVSDLFGAARAAKDARAARLSRPVRAATLLRCNIRLCRRLAAPCRLTAIHSCPRKSTRSIASSRMAPPATETMIATSASMVVVAPVDLAALCCSESNAGRGERGVAGRRRLPATHSHGRFDLCAAHGAVPTRPAARSSASSSPISGSTLYATTCEASANVISEAHAVDTCGVRVAPSPGR